MKTTTTKRKAIADAVELLKEESPNAPGNIAGVQLIPIEKVRAFKDHPFRLYEGERLDDMVQSVRDYGILNPVIVRKVYGGYEMLAGHNRMNAAQIAGMTEVPAIVKTDLSDEDAYVYVIETNVIQRSFTDLAPSEKAAVLSARYEKVISQGRRNDILKEIEEIGTCGHDVHKSRSRDGIGEGIGSGTGQPTGIFTANGGTVGVTAASTTAITADELINLIYSLKSPYRRNAKFLMNDATVSMIRKLKDKNDAYLWQPSLQAGEPDKLLGYDLYTSPYVPVAAAGALTVAFGDFKNYWIADRSGRTVQRLNELYSTNGQVGFVATERVDGQVILPEGIQLLKMKTGSGS